MIGIIGRKMAPDGAVSVWFGPEESPLYGALHLPDGPARGAVVLCPPLGREYSSSHSTFRQLAVLLAEFGLVALRLDYRSTGDSFDRAAGESEGDGFVRDVQYGVDFARATGVASVAIVGMRLGATFAAARSGAEPVDALVLWDPCPSGRSFLREQRALGLLVGARGSEDGGTPEMPGFDLSAGMTTEISGLELLSGRAGSEAPGELGCRVLLLTRGGRAPDRKLAGRFGQGAVEHREVSGQPELLEVQPPRQVVPTEAVVTVAHWLDEVMPRDARPVTVEVPGAVTVAMLRQDPGSTDPAGGEVVAVRERGVSLGPVGLFGIEAAPANGGQSGPACILVSIANEHRIGPGRLWVKLSRQLAAGGFRCVRIDVDGFGDSPPRPGRQDQSEQSVHSVLGIDDILDAAQAVSPEEPGDVVLFGHSSSGYLILEAALELSPRGVCSVNPFLVFQPPEVAAGARIDDRRRFCLPRTALATALVTAARDRSLLQRIDQRYPMLSSRLRKPVRKTTWFVRRIAAPLRSRPGDRLGDLIKAGTDVLLICGSEEFQPFLETGVLAVRRADPVGRLQIEVIPALEHSLLPAKDRAMVSELVLAHVFARFRRPPEA